MKISASLLASLCLFTFACGDDNPVTPETTPTFMRNFGAQGSDWASSVRQTTDGGYVFVGGHSLTAGNGDDVWLFKTNGDGGELWSEKFGGNALDIAFDVQQTTDGGYIIAGQYEVIPYLLVEPEGVPQALLCKIGLQVNALDANYLAKTMRRQDGRFEIKP